MLYSVPEEEDPLVPTVQDCEVSGCRCRHTRQLLAAQGVYQAVLIRRLYPGILEPGAHGLYRSVLTRKLQWENENAFYLVEHDFRAPAVQETMTR